MALTTVQSIEAEIKSLIAQKRLVEERDKEVPKAIAVLQTYAAVLTAVQRRKIASLVDPEVEAMAARTPRKVARPLKGRKLGKVLPKYRLPSGEEWSGRGLTPKAFVAWSKSVEGRSWIKANPGVKFPLANAKGSAAVKTKAPKKAARKRSATKTLKKTTTKARTRRAAATS